MGSPQRVEVGNQDQDRLTHRACYEQALSQLPSADIAPCEMVTVWLTLATTGRYMTLIDPTVLRQSVGTPQVTLRLLT